MNSQTDSIRIPARGIAVGDLINGAHVDWVDATTTPGIVYVWCDGNPGSRARADMILNHGDRVRIVRPDRTERAAAEACINCGKLLDPAVDPAVTTLGPRCRDHFYGRAAGASGSW